MVSSLKLLKGSKIVAREEEVTKLPLIMRRTCFLFSHPESNERKRLIGKSGQVSKLIGLKIIKKIMEGDGRR